MKYADGVSRESNELRCHAKKNCAKGGGREREEKMKKLCGMTSTRERSDNKKAMRGRKEVTVAARHAEGQLCTMRCQQRRTRAEERNTVGGGGVEQEDVRKEQQQATGAQILQAI